MADTSPGMSDSRFAHLLKPIRDLADNWEVDVASELEEYLAELEGLVVSFDGGKTNLNFAQAALMIQNSALIYSKKVELLYDLINRTLQLVQSRNGRRGAAAGGGAGRGRHRVPKALSEEEADILEHEELFLELDDVLQEAHNIDMHEDDPNADIDAYLSAFHAQEAAAVGDGRALPTRTPRGMLGALATQNCGEGGDFRLMTAAMHHGGALLLGGYKPAELSPIPADASTSGWGMGAGAGAGAGTDAGPDHQPPSPTGPHYGDFDGAASYDGGLGHGAPSPATPVYGAGHGAGAGAGAGGVVLRATRPNPWVQLDPHAVAEGASRPLKTGRCYTILKHAAAVSRLGMASMPTVRLPAIASAAPHHTEFAYAVRAERRRKARRRLQHLKQRQQAGVATAALAHAADGDAAGGYGDYGLGAGAPAGGYDSDDGRHSVPDVEFDFDPVPSPRAGTPFVATPGPAGVGRGLTASVLESSAVSYQQLLRHHIEEFMRGCEKYAAETNLSKRVADWRGRMDPLLQEQDVRPEFDIRAYGDSVIETLDTLEEETAPPTKKSGRAPVQGHNFHQVVAGKSPFEVCRVFLACLQLANAGEVELQHDTSEVDTVAHPLRVKVLAK